MASKDPEDPSGNTGETDEETIALRRKRSRRVSFADREITSVHIFNRDEDYETPPKNVPDAEQEKEVLGFFKHLVESDDSKELLASPNEEDYDDDEIVDRKSFLRPNESPSPGSSARGSATSYDEDNFFGPVSTNFIRPGRLSDSAAFDENHDITMDSTAFSMHFRSLARSESEDLKTPFEEKTTSKVDTASDPGSCMVLTNAKNLFPRSPPCVDKASGGQDSDDMSLVGEDRHKYDYGRLSPGLEALLASDHINPKLIKSDASLLEKDGHCCMDQNDHRNMDVGTHDISGEVAPQAHIELGEANDSLTTPIIHRNTHDFEPNANDALAAATGASVDCLQSPDHLDKENKVSHKVLSGMSMPNLEFPRIIDTPLNMNSKALQNLSEHHESGNQHSIVEHLKEDSAKNGRQSSGLNLISDQQHKSSSPSSILSLTAKRQQIILGPAYPSRVLSYITPSPKQPGSFLSESRIKQGESLPSTQKSKSRSKIIDTSPFASTFISRTEKTKLTLSEYFSSTISPSNAVTEEISKRLKHKHLEPPITNLQEQLSSAYLGKARHDSMINVDGDGIGTPKMANRLSQVEDIRDLEKDGESPDHMSANLLQGQPTTVASQSKFTWSGKKAAEGLFVAENLAEGTAVISRSDSLLMDITFNHGKNKKTSNATEKFLSPVKKLDQRSLSSTDYGDVRQQDHCNELFGIGTIKEGNSFEVVSSSNYLTTMSDKSDSLLFERKAPSSSPLTETNRLKNFNEVKRLDYRERNLLDLQNVPEKLQSFKALGKDMVALKFQSESPGKNLPLSTQDIWSSEELPVERIKSSSVSASPYGCRSVNEMSLLKSPSKAEQTQRQSPSEKKLHNVSHGNNLQFLVSKDAQSPNSNSNSYGNENFHQEFNTLRSHFLEQDAQNCSRQKRKSEEIIPEDVDHSDKINRVLRSQKFHKSRDCELESMLEHSNGNNLGNENIGGGTTSIEWTDISQKFSAETNQLLSPLIDRINTGVMGTVESYLSHLKKVHLFEMLCSEIQSQRTYDTSSSVRQKRQAEIRLLLIGTAYEKAKLQLMHLKHEKLLKRVQKLCSVIRESEMLRLNYNQHVSVPGERDAQADDNLHPSCLINSEGNLEVSSHKTTKMKQEFEALDRKIKNIAKSFHIYCKMKGELSFDDTLLLLNDHLKKRMCCRFIRHDMQLWEVDDVEIRNGYHSVVLNYQGFICQRLAVNPWPVSNLFVSNKFSDAIIMEKFPNMDAGTAFTFLFNAESTKKYIGSKCLAQETQTTSLLLHNLLSIVEEVRLARLEIQNLIQTNFCSPSSEQLNLQLSFIDFDNGRKVVMTLDMTSLNCGIYPSEILPCKLQAFTSGEGGPVSQSLCGEIKAAYSNLRVGYSRIIRLCRRVSEILQS